MLDLRPLIGTHDVLMVTLDALRFDVAQEALEYGLTPRLADWLPHSGWEKRHSPGNFTYSAHQAFFAGFLPTPVEPGNHPRIFATRFDGSMTTSEMTLVFDAPDIVSGFAAAGYHTVCIGGVGFFNKKNPLGNVLPSFFAESHWDESLGVTDDKSTENQVHLGQSILRRMDPDKRLFMFLNISALHQPNCIFADGATVDSKQTQAAALSYVDKHLPDLFHSLSRRAPLAVLLFSDHGTAYGEDGYVGHRVSHETVWTVPYSEFVVSKRADS